MGIVQLLLCFLTGDAPVLTMFLKVSTNRNTFYTYGLYSIQVLPGIISTLCCSTYLSQLCVPCGAVGVQYYMQAGLDKVQYELQTFEYVLLSMDSVRKYVYIISVLRVAQLCILSSNSQRY
jgi:hypothetical protein